MSNGAGGSSGRSAFAGLRAVRRPVVGRTSPPARRQRERLSPFGEGQERDPDSGQHGLDVLQAGGFAELSQMTLTCSGQPGLVASIGINVTDDGPSEAGEASTATAWSQTQAVTTPPGRVTRDISRVHREGPARPCRPQPPDQFNDRALTSGRLRGTNSPTAGGAAAFAGDRGRASRRHRAHPGRQLAASAGSVAFINASAAMCVIAPPIAHPGAVITAPTMTRPPRLAHGRPA